MDYATERITKIINSATLDIKPRDHLILNQILMNVYTRYMGPNLPNYKLTLDESLCLTRDAWLNIEFRNLVSVQYTAYDTYKVQYEHINFHRSFDDFIVEKDNVIINEYSVTVNTHDLPVFVYDNVNNQHLLSAYAKSIGAFFDAQIFKILRHLTYLDLVYATLGRSRCDFIVGPSSIINVLKAKMQDGHNIDLYYSDRIDRSVLLKTDGSLSIHDGAVRGGFNNTGISLPILVLRDLFCECPDDILSYNSTKATFAWFDGIPPSFEDEEIWMPIGSTCFPSLFINLHRCFISSNCG